MDPQTRLEFVEEFATVLENPATSRSAARVFAFLLTDDQPYRSLTELTQELGLSKGSISTNTRILIAQGMIRRVPVVGSRMEHYGVEGGGLHRALEAAAVASRHVSQLAAKALTMSKGAETASALMLTEMHETYGNLADAIETLAAEKK